MVRHDINEDFKEFRRHKLKANHEYDYTFSGYVPKYPKSQKYGYPIPDYYQSAKFGMGEEPKEDQEHSAGGESIPDPFIGPGSNGYPGRNRSDVTDRLATVQPPIAHGPPPPPSSSPMDYPPPRGLKKPTEQESGKKLNVLEHFGLYSNIPTTAILKGCSIVVLIILVELNTIINLNTLHPLLAESIGSGAQPFIGISLIGVFLGILFRYMDFELYQLKSLPLDQRKGRFKSYLTIIFLLAIGLFIVLEVIVELINARGFLARAPAGALFLLDLLIILIVTVGTYTIFSTNRSMTIVTILLLFIIMVLGIDYGSDLPTMVVLGGLMVVYIEVTDGALRLNEYIDKFHTILETRDQNRPETLMAQIEHRMDRLAIQFTKSLVMYFTLTMVITGMLLLIFVSYPYFTPAFIHENLELQTVYAVIPIIALLFVIFLLYKLFSKYLFPIENEQK
ncbi:hypothetical protein [[Eubacterium] cellulosolvens]